MKKKRSYVIALLWLAAAEVLLFVGFSLTGEPGKPFTFGEWFWLLLIVAIMIWVAYKLFKASDQLVSESKFKEVARCQK